MRSSITNMKRLAVIAFAFSSYLYAADPIFMRRQVSDVQPKPDDLTAAGSKAASYKPLFGIGDQDVDQLKGVARYGELTVEPRGTSAVVSYPAEEQMYYVEEGNGMVLYGDEKAPVKANDFMYLPAGVKHGIANSSNAPVKVVVMGYKIPAGTLIKPTPKLMLASADDVQLQVLGQHGPTTQFKLLMGTASSQRDKLASAYVMDSLFIMDFAPGGTNIPHNHPAEEEIYLLLRGSGDMVAGLDANGKEVRHPVTQGAAFFFKPGTQVGYYSNAQEGQPHDLMLAVRSRVPGMSMRGSGGRGGREGRGGPANQPGRQP
jgi:mannose-6-phosphate isomerase-like protein (cupin superfamily)